LAPFSPIKNISHHTPVLLLDWSTIHSLQIQSLNKPALHKNISSRTVIYSCITYTLIMGVTSHPEMLVNNQKTMLHKHPENQQNNDHNNSLESHK
jgi:hypothetical protein